MRSQRAEAFETFGTFGTFGRDGVLRDGVLRDGALRDGVLRDGVHEEPHRRLRRLRPRPAKCPNSEISQAELRLERVLGGEKRQSRPGY